MNHPEASLRLLYDSHAPPHVMVTMLRPLFASHEKNMRTFVGLQVAGAAEGEKAPTAEQKMIPEAAMKMMEAAKVSPE